MGAGSTPAARDTAYRRTSAPTNQCTWCFFKSESSDGML